MEADLFKTQMNSHLLTFLVAHYRLIDFSMSENFPDPHCIVARPEYLASVISFRSRAPGRNRHYFAEAVSTTCPQFKYTVNAHKNIIFFPFSAI